MDNFILVKENTTKGFSLELSLFKNYSRYICNYRGIRFAAEELGKSSFNTRK